MAETVHDGVPARDGARIAPLSRLSRLLARARRGEHDGDIAHRLRTTSRRAEAALALLAAHADQRHVERAGRMLRRVRKAAGPVRACDVHLGVLAEFIERAPPELRRAAERARRLIERDRAVAAPALQAVAQRFPKRKVRRLARRLDDARGCPDAALRGAITGVRESSRAIELAALHELRTRIKRLRYTLALVKPALDESTAQAESLLVELQEALGRVRDAHEIAERLARYAEHSAEGAAEGLALLARRFALLRDARLRETRMVLEAAVENVLQAVCKVAVTPRPTAPPALAGARPPAGAARLAAIDVGTNSVRLMVVEAHGASAYRVLDDEKEITRLGAGLERTGAMSRAAIAATVNAVDRFRRIAEGYRVDALRIVGTSACREATNTAELASGLRGRTGLDLEVISAEEEGRLAFQSAAHSFDLRDAPAAVIDIGGGSTEVVLSAAGAIERIASLRLGAVRTTERHGGARHARGRGYERMRKRVRRVIRRTLGAPGLSPQTVVGIGGTFTTLAAILQHREYGPRGPSLWDRSIPGHEVKRSELRHVLDWLRSLSEDDLLRVPGLPPERTDIIVAGLTIAERLLKHLGANVVHVHDRGIRDGIVLGLASSLFSADPDAGRPDSMIPVRRFAETCRYEAAHSEHVARLALSIHEQLAAALGEGGGWASPASRRLLEAAGVLHDIGYLVNYSKHHRHGYHLIVHSGLSGLSRRELEIIGNLAFYHRQAEPSAAHPNFAALGADDRELVRRLAAILRVADGLDRTHTQQVHGVGLEVARGRARFAVRAEGDPSTDLWGAERKSGLFREAFGLTPEFALDGAAARIARQA